MIDVVCGTFFDEEGIGHVIDGSLQTPPSPSLIWDRFARCGEMRFTDMKVLALAKPTCLLCIAEI